jgi:hypothetical protein
LQNFKDILLFDKQIKKFANMTTKRTLSEKLKYEYRKSLFQFNEFNCKKCNPPEKLRTKVKQNDIEKTEKLKICYLISL